MVAIHFNLKGPDQPPQSTPTPTATEIPPPGAGANAWLYVVSALIVATVAAAAVLGTVVGYKKRPSVAPLMNEIA